MRSLVGCLVGAWGLVLAACGAAGGEPPAAADPAAGAGAPRGDVCAPLVSGCGCAYQCGLGRPRPDGRYDVTHDFQDSRVDLAALGRRCFDAEGRAYHEGAAPAAATRCIDVLDDLGACGGECIPSVDFLDCALSEGRCAPL